VTLTASLIYTLYISLQNRISLPCRCLVTDPSTVLCSHALVVTGWQLSYTQPMTTTHFSRWLLLYHLSTNRIENTISNSSSVVACITVAKETCLLATVGTNFADKRRSLDLVFLVLHNKGFSIPFFQLPCHITFADQKILT
jgi:hypothetical protein